MQPVLRSTVRLLRSLKSLTEVVDSITCDECGGCHFSIPVYDDGEVELSCIGCGEPLDRGVMVKVLSYRSGQ